MHTACSSSRLLGRGSASVQTEIPSPRCGPGDPPQVCAWRPPWYGPGDPLSVCLETPLGVGLETPFRPDPSTSFLGVGLETCKACWDTNPPPSRPARQAGIPPTMHAGIPPPPPCGQNSWHTLLAILPCPSFVAGGKDFIALFAEFTDWASYILGRFSFA